jgi:hypothetical protein
MPSRNSPVAIKWVFWTVMLSLPIIAAAVGIQIAAYRFLEVQPFVVEGKQIIIFDPEIGFVPSRQGNAKKIYNIGGARLEYHVYTDKRGARVSRLGEQTQEPVRIIFVGDSCTWGDRIEGGDTFSYGVAKRLDVSTANLSMGSYGTTQSLQLLRRNLDLAPRLIVYSFIDSHLQRNLNPCATSYYPFCLDQSHVTWKEGIPVIAPPFSNGVRRTQLHAKAQHRGLWPHTWVMHGLDVVLGKFLYTAGNKAAGDPSKQNAALEFLLRELSNTAKSINAELLIVYIPANSATIPPAPLLQPVASLNLQFLDLSPAFERRRGESLYVPGDGHPSVEGHSLIAEEIASTVQTRHLLR